MSRLPRWVALLALAGCSYGTVNTGPYSHGKELRDYRLARIANDPSPAGMDEAMKRLVRAPDDELALTAVKKNLPHQLDAMEPHFPKLAESRQATLLEYLGETTDGPAVSAFMLRQLPNLSPEIQRSAISALAGDQDDVALNGLVGLAKGSDANLRGLAIAGLEPATTELAQTTLIGIYSSKAEDGAIRRTALTAMNPHELAAFRAAMVVVGAAEDNGVAAATFDALGTSTAGPELDAALSAMAHAAPQARAVAFLGRAVPWRADVREALHGAVELENPAARWEAAAALVAQDDEVGGAPMVAFLDDPERRTDAVTALDSWELSATDALRAKGGTLTTAEGKAALITLLADVGGPSDAKLLSKLGASDEQRAPLAYGPHGLYPDATARWGDLDSLAPVERQLSDAIVEQRALAAATEDPYRLAVHHSRAWAAGGRSDASRATASAALNKATSGFQVPLNIGAKTEGEFAGATLVDAAESSLSRSIKAPIRKGSARHSALPEAHLGGTLTCTDDYQNKDWAPMYETEQIPYTIKNPDKEACFDWLRGIPKTETRCNWTCHVANVGVYSTCSNCSCSDGPSTPSNGWCTPQYVQVNTPEWEAGVEQCGRIEEYITEYASRQITKIQRVRDTVTSCTGELSVSFGPKKTLAAVDFQETKTEQWWTYSAPSGTLPNGESVGELFEDNKFYQSTDERRARLENVLANKLSGLTASEAEVRALYEQAIAPLLAAGKTDEALMALFFAKPALSKLDSKVLHDVLFLDGAAAFPMAWQPTPDAAPPAPVAP